ncbi:transposase, partial [Thermostichus sp. MS-CIW-25]
YISKIYRKNVLWNESYFIASCGGVTVSALSQHIENQGTPASHPGPSAPRR